MDQERPGSNPGQPVFLEPQTYRRRRLMDGARMLPVLGVSLWMVPLLWPTQNSEAGQSVPMSSAMTYIFVVWLGLICIAAGIWLKTRGTTSEDPDTPESPETQRNGPEKWQR